MRQPLATPGHVRPCIVCGRLATPHLHPIYYFCSYRCLQLAHVNHKEQPTMPTNLRAELAATSDDAEARIVAESTAADSPAFLDLLTRIRGAAHKGNRRYLIAESDANVAKVRTALAERLATLGLTVEPAMGQACYWISWSDEGVTRG